MLGTSLRVAAALGVALTLGASAATAQTAAADYFPLRVGNQWTYDVNPSAGLHAWQATTKVRTARTIGNSRYYLLEGYQGGNHWVHETSTQRVYEAGSRHWYSLGATQGTAWLMHMIGGAPGSDGARLSLASRTETLSTPAGTFQNCIRLDYVRYGTPVADAGVISEWFAPNIGLVKRVDHAIYGTLTSTLASATVNGRTFPAPDPLVATLTITPDSVGVGQGAPPRPGTPPPGPDVVRIVASFHVAASGAPVVVRTGGQQYDFVVRDTNGREIYRWSQGKFFPMIMYFKTIDRRGLDYTETIELTNPPIGDLTVEAIAVMNPAPQPAVKILHVIPRP